jgi:hypothetical protein
VKFAATDIGAIFRISGGGSETPLALGDNKLVVTVTAADGTIAEYTVNLKVMPKSENSDLADEDPVKIDGVAVDTALLNDPAGVVSLPISATKIAVEVNAFDKNADVLVNGRTVQPSVARDFNVGKGLNLFEIKVIPVAGEAFAKTYKLRVFAGGADTSVKTIKVNNNVISMKDNAGVFTTPLPNGTTSAKLFVEPTVELADGAGDGTKVEIDATNTKDSSLNTYNLTELLTGENTVTITVYSADGVETGIYTVLITVAGSSDKSLKAFKINGIAVPVGSIQVVEKGVTSVDLDAEITSDLSSFESFGGDSLVIGLNTVKITVTAEDLSTQVYTVTVIVPKAVDKIVIPFSKVGFVAVDGKTNKPGNKILVAEIKKLTKAKAKVVKVTIANNFLIKKDKAKAGPARAKAIQKYLSSDKAAVKVKGLKTLKYDLVAGPKKQKGATVAIYYY